jgi:hypothetical protein
MSGQHCMMCQLSRKQFNQNKDKVGLPWSYDDLVCIGTEVCTERRGKPLLGVKQEPWWPFLKLLMVPLLHCLIGIGNNLINRLCDVVHEYVEILSAAEMKLARALINYGLIMVKTAKKRDEFNASPEGKKQKALKAWFSSTRKCAMTIPNADDIKMKEQELKLLDEMRQVMVDKFIQTRNIISITQNNLHALQLSKAKSATSHETKLLNVLKKIGVGQSSYHGGSLNGKDIKKVMNNV